MRCRKLITAELRRVVRINGLDTLHWKEDIRVCCIGGADTHPYRKDGERAGRTYRRGACSGS